MTDSVELKIQNETLQTAIDGHKQAYKAISDDFIKYQDQTDLIISELKLKIQDLEANLSYERQQNDQLDRKVSYLSNQLTKKQEESQELTCQLKQSIINYDSLLQSSAEQLNENKEINQQIQASANTSELQFTKLAYNTTLQEVSSLRIQLAQERSMQKDLQKQIAALKSQLDNQHIDQNVLELNQKVADLQATLYKSLTIIAALGCPFDIFSEDVIKDIKSFCAGDEHREVEASITKVQDLIYFGLQLMGLRPKDGGNAKSGPKQLTMTQTAVQRSNNAANPEQLVTVTNKTLLDRNYETFRTLIRKCEILESKNALLQTESIHQQEEIKQLRQRIEIMQKQNEKLMEISKKEVQVHRQIYDTQLRHNEKCLEVARKSQQQISNVRNACLQEVSCLAALNSERQKIITFVASLQSALDRIAAEGSELGGAVGPVELDLNGAIKALKELNLQPKVYDVRSILVDDLNLPIPPNYLKTLESFYNAKIEQLSENRTVNERLSRLLMVFVLLFNSKDNITNNDKLKDRSLVKTAVAKMKWFHDQVIGLAKSNNISQEDIIEYYNANDEKGELLDPHTVTEQYVMELNDQLQNLRTMVKQDAEGYHYQCDTLLEQYEHNSDLVKLVNTADQMNTSRRYVAFLEILINLMMNYISSASGNIFNIADQMSRLSEQQLQQNELFKIQFKDFTSKLESTNKQLAVLKEEQQQCVGTMEQIKAANQQVVQKVPAILSSLEQYCDQIRNIMTIMEKNVYLFENNAENPQNTLLSKYAGGDKNIQSKESQQVFKQIGSQLLDLQTKMTQFQEYIYQDREKVRNYIDVQKKQDQQKIVQLRDSFTQSEIKRKKQEEDAWLVRQRYTQLSEKYQETKDRLTKQIKTLQEQLQRTMEEKVSALRRNKEDLVTSFRKKEEILEDQIALLRQSTIDHRVSQSLGTMSQKK